MIVLVSDNGASGEGGPNGSVNENKFFNGLPDTIEENLKYLDELGSPADLQPLSDRLGVGVQHAVQDVEALLELRGRHRRPDDRLLAGPDQGSRACARQYTHAVDIVPTIYELLGIELPEVVKGYTQHPLEGVSFAASLRRRRRQDGKQTQFYSMLGTRGDLARRLEGRRGDARRARSVGATSPTQRWELFDTEADPSECHDLAERASREAAGADRALVGRGGRYGALPLEIARRDRDPARTDGRSSPSRANRYIYYPDCAEVPESVAPNIRNRSYTIAVEVTIDTAGGERRPVRAGLALRRPRALPQGRQAQVRLQLGRRVRADRRVDRAGPDRRTCVLSASFEQEGDAMPTEGTLTLYIGDEQVGEGRIKTQPGKFSLAGEGLNVGKDGGEPVTDDYAGDSPWAFVGGHDPPGHDRRQRRAVGRPRVRARRGIRARLTETG